MAIPMVFGLDTHMGQGSGTFRVVAPDNPDWVSVCTYPVGPVGLSAVFIGDGAQHDLNNGWLFAYQNNSVNFYRNVPGAPLRFADGFLDNGSRSSLASLRRGQLRYPAD